MTQTPDAVCVQSLVALFTIDDRPPGRRAPGQPPKELKVLLLGPEGDSGAWRLPGGPVTGQDTLVRAALRTLGEGVGPGIHLEQLRTYDDLDPGPPRTIVVAHIGLVPPAVREAVRPSSPATWVPVDEPPLPAPGRLPLVAGHARVLAEALQRLRNKVDYTLLAFQMLPEEFTMSELRQVYEAILGEDLGTSDERRKANFERSIRLLNERVGRLMEARTGVFQPPIVRTGRTRKGPRGPAAHLYRFVGDITLITK